MTCKQSVGIHFLFAIICLFLLQSGTKTLFHVQIFVRSTATLQVELRPRQRELAAVIICDAQWVCGLQTATPKYT